MTNCRRVSLEEFRNLLDPSSPGELLVLAGAGVSIPAPTSLPSGNRLRDLCVEQLLTDGLSRRAVRRLLGSAGYRSLLPESVLQMIGSTVGNGLDLLMRRLLGISPPNVIHQALASRKYRVFTTNFDLCLERAGIKQVSHLHGSIKNPEQLQNRLYRLGKTALSEARQFEKQLGRGTLLVIGYSFRDDDIVRLIQRHTPVRVLFLTFDGTLPQAVKNLNSEVLFAQGSAQDLFMVQPEKVSRARARRPPANFRLPALKHRVNALIRICSRAGMCDTQLRLLRLYTPKLHGRDRLLAICEVADSLRLARRYEEAELLAKLVLDDRFSRLPECRDVVSTGLVQLGLISLDCGDQDFDKIAGLFRQASQVFDDLVKSEPPGKYDAENDIWRARIMNNVGLLLAAQGEAAKSIRMYRRSIRLKAKHHDRYGISQTLANIAAAEILDGKLNAAAKTAQQLVVRLTQDPDAYICADAVVGCLGALRKTNRLRARIRNLTSVPTRPERWWQDLLSASQAAPRPEMEILTALQRLSVLRRGLPHSKTASR
jgi:tetratricopeptide (TPR) repeat protein